MEPERPVAKTPDPAVKKPDEPVKPAEPQKPAVDPKTQDRQFQGPKELREYAKRLEGETKDLRAKVADAESKLQKAADAGKNTEALTARLNDLEKKLQESESARYALDVESSPEFKDKYEKPFNDAAEFARQQVEQLEITVMNEEGEVTGSRPAKFDDFVALYNLPLNKAMAVAKAQFGEAAQLVINHLAELQRLNITKSKAAKEAREGAAAKRKAQEDERVARESSATELNRRLWSEINRDVENRNPDMQPDPQDTKEADIMKKSFALVDSAFADRSAQTPQQRVTLDVEIRHRAAREPLLRYRLKKAANEIAELKGVIDNMQKNGVGMTNNPGGGQPAGGGAEESLDQGLDALEKELEKTAGPQGNY